MSTHNIFFHGEIRKISTIFVWGKKKKKKKALHLDLCPNILNKCPVTQFDLFY